MPLTKRLVEPVHVCRERIPPGIKNELEFVSNTALASIIQQLSSLSKHAEDIFIELTAESHGVIQRSASLKNRIDRLTMKVTQLDANVEEVTLQDINIRKHFRSNNCCEQQVVGRDTLANAMKDVYDMCDPPPPLNQLNQFRTDGKEGLKFYTDPDYFFNLWKQKMLEVDDRHRPDRIRKAGRARTPNDTKTPKMRPQNDRWDAARVQSQEDTASPVTSTSVVSPNIYQHSQQLAYSHGSAAGGYGVLHHSVPPAASYDAGRYGTIRSQSRPARLDLPYALPSTSLYEACDQHQSSFDETIHMVDYRGLTGQDMTADFISARQLTDALRDNLRATPTRPINPPPAPPAAGSGSTRSTPTASLKDDFPPPPPSDAHVAAVGHSPTMHSHRDFPAPPSTEKVVRGNAGPPPPPPPPSGNILPVVAQTLGDQQLAASSRHQPSIHVTSTVLDARSDLLKAIRSGINLRKVEQQEAQQQHSTKVETSHKSLHNVAEILMRRKAIQHSDSDTSSETEADSEWDEHV